MRPFERFENPTTASFLRKTDLFEGANYLWSDPLFDRLRTAAREGRIQIENFSLARAENFKTLMAGLKAKDIPLAAFDLSNAWWEGFLKASELDAVISAARERAGNGGMILVTDRVKGKVAELTEYPQFQRRGEKSWVYFAYPFGFVDGIGGPGPFRDFLFLEADRVRRESRPNDVTPAPNGCVVPLAGAAPAPG